jgi:hypothetical protein
MLFAYHYITPDASPGMGIPGNVGITCSVEIFGRQRINASICRLVTYVGNTNTSKQASPKKMAHTMSHILPDSLPSQLAPGEAKFYRNPASDLPIVLSSAASAK